MSFGSIPKLMASLTCATTLRKSEVETPERLEDWLWRRLSSGKLSMLGDTDISSLVGNGKRNTDSWLSWPFSTIYLFVGGANAKTQNKTQKSGINILTNTIKEWCI